MLRATLKGLLQRKLRVALAVVAVLLGVGFVSAANILTDTLSAGFDRLFATVSEGISVTVNPKEQESSTAEPPLLTDDDIAELERVDGVDRVVGSVSTMGVIPFHTDTGKGVQNFGPMFGFGLDPDGFSDPDALLQVADGEAPNAAGEIAITRHTAALTGAEVGDTLKVYLPFIQESREFTVVGVLEYSGGRASLSGETAVVFTVAEGQELFYGKTGVFSGADLYSDGSVSDADLKERVAEVIPAGFEAKTGEEFAEEQSSEIKESLGFINWFFLAFAGVALLVGIFLIFNTFTIVAAQRSRELALYRALGASRRQVTGTMLIEALIVGLIGSALGLGFGAALGAGIAGLFKLSNVPLPVDRVVISLATILAAFAVGITVTLVSALVPAVRASGVPPIAAMRDVVKPDKPLRWLVAGGLVLTVGGAVAVGFALRGLGEATMSVLALGVLLSFLGVALLSPALTRPIAGLVGWLLSWGAASRLGRRNALRNPRRTAITASALMIGVTLVSALGVLGASFKATTLDVLNDQRGADVIITTIPTQEAFGREGFHPDKLDEIRDIDGVEVAVPLHFSGATVDGEQSFVLATEVNGAKGLFAMVAEKGTLDIAEDELVVDEDTAERNGWAVGDRITIDLPKGGEREFTIAGIYSSELGMAGVVLDSSAAQYFAGDLAYEGYLKLSEDADSEAVVAEVEEILADYPLVTVTDRSELVEQVNMQITFAQTTFNVLLLLAVVIAFLGIMNTLLLSVYERTRELGMLRAIGMARTQVKRMIRVESVIMAVFGCLLGIALGLALGYAVTSALVDQGRLTAIDWPGWELVSFVVVAVVAGVVAAWWPAFRASRLNVLEAIAYE